MLQSGIPTIFQIQNTQKRTLDTLQTGVLEAVRSRLPQDTLLSVRKQNQQQYQKYKRQSAITRILHFQVTQ